MKNSKTVFVSFTGSAGVITYSKDIFVPFKCNEIVLKSYTLSDHSTGNTKPIILVSNLVPDGTLLCTTMGNDVSVFINTIFQVSGINVNGTYNFEWRLFNNLPLESPTTFSYDRVIQLVFNEY